MNKLNTFLIGAGAAGLMAGCNGEINSGTTQAEINAALQQEPTAIVERATGENSFNTPFVLEVVERPSNEQNDIGQSGPEGVKVVEEPDTIIRINPEHAKNSVPAEEQGIPSDIETININGGSEPEVDPETEIIRTNPAPGEETNDTTQNDANAIVMRAERLNISDMILDPNQLRTLSETIGGQNVTTAIYAREGLNYNLSDGTGYVFDSEGNFKGPLGEVSIAPNDIIAVVDNNPEDNRKPIIRTWTPGN